MKVWVVRENDYDRHRILHVFGSQAALDNWKAQPTGFVSEEAGQWYLESKEFDSLIKSFDTEEEARAALVGLTCGDMSYLDVQECEVE